MKKILFIILILIMNINSVSAVSMSVFNIPNVVNEQTFTYNNNMLSEFKAVDNTDRITQIIVLMDNSFPENTGLLINLSNNFTYELVADKYSFMGLNTYMNVNQSLTYQNYTVFTDSKSVPNFLNNQIMIIITYDTKTKQTIISERHTTGIMWDYHYDTINYIGMPSTDIKINGLSKYDVSVTVTDMSSSLGLGKARLSLFSGIVYGILTFKFTIPLTNLSVGFGENETLLNLLLLIDLFFFYMSVFFIMLVTYPFLILVWIFTIGNMFIAYKSNSIRDIVFNFQIYYTYITNKIYVIGTYLIQVTIRIITAITNMIP